MRKSFLAGLVFPLLLSLWPQTGSAATYTLYTSGFSNEGLTSIPGDNTKHVLFSLGIPPGLAVGDILLVRGEAQVSLNETDTRKIACQLMLGSSPSTTDTESGGLQLDQNNAFNVSPDMVRGVPVKIATYRVTTAMGVGAAYVNFVVWASGNFNVDHGEGDLGVLVIHP
jgi:hypothetical protein